MPIVTRESDGNYEFQRLVSREADGNYQWVRAVTRESDGFYEWPLGGKLYTASHGSTRAGELYEVDRTTGVATKVFDRPGFGVREYNPEGMAWDGANLYMAGRRNRLYTVNVENGLATRVGNQSILGSGSPSGMAWDGTNILIVESQNDAIWGVNRTTGRADGNLFWRLPSTLTGPSGMTWDGNDLYVLNIGFGARVAQTGIHRINRSVSPVTSTKIGNAINFGANITTANGLTWDGTQFLIVDTINDALFSVSRTTGIATRIGNADRFGVNLGQVTSLVWVQ